MEMKCDVCDKSFTGLVCFQQHEASEKHKKKVQLIKGFGFEMPKTTNFPDSMTKQDNLVELMPNLSDSRSHFECAVCKISFPGLDNYQKHVNSLDHAIMVQKRNNDILNPILSSPFQTITAQSQMTESAASFISPSKANAFFSECKPCRKQFSGPEPYQQHLESAGHMKKCRLSTDTIQNDEIDSIARKDKLDDKLPYGPQSSESACNLNETVPQPFAKCDTCEMQFNEALSYQLHLVSDCHKMKTSNELLGNSFTASQSAFKCDVCVMTFSGPIPYKQHLISNGHKKKIHVTNLSKQLAATGSLLSYDTTLKDSYTSHEQSLINDRQWYCNICNKQCSGPIPFNTHIAGREHTKLLKAKEIEAKLQKSKVLGSLPFVENNENESDLANGVTSTVNLDLNYKSDLEESTVKFQINDLNKNIQNDSKVLSDSYKIKANDLIDLPNFNIIPPEKLDITVFQPMDEIVFSSPKKCMQE